MTAPTPYHDVNTLLRHLLAQLTAILGNDLVGFYLDGSLALGDFDPAHSDVDFIAAVAGPLSSAARDALATMHRRLTTGGHPFGSELEGSYIPLSALRRHDPDDALHPNIERGLEEVLQPKEHHSDWVIHRHVVREHGIALLGPPPASLIDPVSPADIRRATAGVLHSWWGTASAAETILDAHAGYLAYVVHTMCRARYSLERGDVVSKPAACRWALATQRVEWRRLIARSMRREMTGAMRDEVLAFVRLTAAEAVPAK